jgi:hypothetical protein
VRVRVRVRVRVCVCVCVCWGRGGGGVSARDCAARGHMQTQGKLTSSSGGQSSSVASLSCCSSRSAATMRADRWAGSVRCAVACETGTLGGDAVGSVTALPAFGCLVSSTEHHHHQPPPQLSRFAVPSLTQSHAACPNGCSGPCRAQISAGGRENKHTYHIHRPAAAAAPCHHDARGQAANRPAAGPCAAAAAVRGLGERQQNREWYRAAPACN